VSKEQKVLRGPAGMQSLFAPAGFTIESGFDGGPYILITSENGSRGVHHPEKKATRAQMQDAIYALAERVVAAEGRSKQRAAQMHFEITQLVKGGMDRTDALVKWKADRRKAASEKEAARG
jgi:hypothetical protein